MTYNENDSWGRKTQLQLIQMMKKKKKLSHVGSIVIQERKKDES